MERIKRRGRGSSGAEEPFSLLAQMCGIEKVLVGGVARFGAPGLGG